MQSLFWSLQLDKTAQQVSHSTASWDMSRLFHGILQGLIILQDSHVSLRQSHLPKLQTQPPLGSSWEIFSSRTVQFVKAVHLYFSGIFRYTEISTMCFADFFVQMLLALWLCMPIHWRIPPPLWCQDHPIEEVMDYIDWTPFFQADRNSTVDGPKHPIAMRWWSQVYQLRGKYPNRDYPHIFKVCGDHLILFWSTRMFEDRTGGMTLPRRKDCRE